MRGQYDEIGQASLLGFIPTNYPAGVILAEVWRNGQIEKVTGIVGNIETDTEWNFGRYFTGPDSMERARNNMVARAIDNGAIPEFD